MLERKKDWDLANQYLDAFKTGFYQDRDIQGDPLSYGRPGLKATEGEKAIKDELERADDMAKKFNLTRIALTKETLLNSPRIGKIKMLYFADLLMRAKVQFINGDLTGATESYRTIETRFSTNYEAKEMLKRIARMRSEESYLGYLKNKRRNA